MGAALWRRIDAEEEPAAQPLPHSGCRYRIEVFGDARAPWRDTAAAAMKDAVRLGLASWDASASEHYLAVPVDMKIEHPPARR